MQSSLACKSDPEFLREELIGGEVVAIAPAKPRHNRLGFKIASILDRHLLGRQCVVLPDNTLVRLTEKDHFIPDVLVVCDRSKIKEDYVEGPPDLVVEVLSPSTAKRDKWDKKNVYESSGVGEYWLVSPTDRSIEVYLLEEGRYRLDDVYTYLTEEALERLSESDRARAAQCFPCALFPDLTVKLEDIFGDML